MLGLSKVVIVIVLFINFSKASNDCSLLSSNYFQWVSDSSTSILKSNGLNRVEKDNDSCCGANCNEAWEPLRKFPNCNYCISNNALVCQGTRVYTIPSPEDLPTKNLSLYKMSGVGVIALPPKVFTGLSIQNLVIENSNVIYIDPNTFSGVKSVKSLYLRNNTLDYLPQAGDLLRDLQELVILDLGNNELKVVSSLRSANLKTLQYFSLEGNPIYTLNLFFLQNSSLKYLNLRGVQFRVKVSYMEDSGFSSLPSTLSNLDLSYADISVKAIEKMVLLLSEKNITTLNLNFLQSSDGLLFSLLPIKKSLQYLSLEGTDMNYVFPLKLKAEVEKDNLLSTPEEFVNLKELNLKNCKIQQLGNGDVFKAFPNLDVLSLADNNFVNFDLTMFLNLPKLNFLDVSINSIGDIHNIDSTVSGLHMLDMSLVDLDVDKNKFSYMFTNTLPHLEMLSLCSAKINNDHIKALTNLSNLKFLDLSDTLTTSPNLVSSFYDLFTSLNSSLTELYFTRNNFKWPSTYPSFFSQILSLKSLDLSNNLIRELSPGMFGPVLESLKISQNLVTTWYSSVIDSKSQLRDLDLSSNQVTYISDAMIHDFYMLSSLDLNNNPLICHNKVVAMVCANMKLTKFNLTMVDWQQYHCYDVLSNSYRLFSQPKDCEEYYEEVSTMSGKDEFTTGSSEVKDEDDKPTPVLLSWKNYYIFIIPVLFITFGSVVYKKWWKIRCYFHQYFSLRKARLLRKNGGLMRPEMHYDVFVSYSDVDRAWVLDHLIPNIEGDGDISLCFHERDFKVGLGILENIIECMDRSHSLLLIVSGAFVRSKWCQFEMHLAQYRLIETLRDQLVLVLLEDIPRKSRPQVLHHLMMTKTYLLWPQELCKEDAKELFWKRLKRALRPHHSYIINI